MAKPDREQAGATALLRYLEVGGVHLEQPGPAGSARGIATGALAGGVTLAYLGLRLPGLMALPIFCDEAIYLRYAQLIHRHPLGSAFVSLVDPKPPFHYWLLASIFALTSDPLLAARLLSVAAGLASILVMVPLCRELRVLCDGASTGDGQSGSGRDAFTVSSILLFLTCPFLAFYQRMALAESLLVLETLVVAWLGLALAREAASGAPPRSLLGRSLALGLWMGSALLTKQNSSYTLLALPVLAGVMWRGKLSAGEGRRRLLRAWLVAFGLALLLFSPILFICRGPGLRDRLFFYANHGRFGGGLAWHARLAWENLLYVFVPVTIRKTGAAVLYEGFAAPADAGWLWIYLTPPIFLFSLVGLAALAWRGRIRLLAFLVGWIFLMLLPFVPFATTAVSRYALLAVPPMLAAAASCLDWLWRRISSRPRLWILPTLALLVWPLTAIALQDGNWQKQPFTRSDRWQYVSGWPAGFASRLAVEAVAGMAARAPIVLITTRLPGTPNDVVWTYLEGRPNVRLYFVDWAFRSPILRTSSGAGPVELLSDFHQAAPSRKLVTVRPGVPVLFLGMDPYPSPRGGIPAGPLLRPLNPTLQEVARFENPTGNPAAHREAVVIYRLR